MIEMIVETRYFTLEDFAFHSILLLLSHGYCYEFHSAHRTYKTHTLTSSQAEMSAYLDELPGSFFFSPIIFGANNSQFIGCFHLVTPFKRLCLVRATLYKLNKNWLLANF